MNDELREAYRRWRENVLKPNLERFPERRDSFATSSGVPLERLYLPDHPDPDYLDKRGFPGAPPYTRGVYPTMYRSRLWTMRQYAGFGSAAETNQRFRYLLEQGQTGLSVAFDLPTQIGYDPDHPLASGEVGRVGVSITSLENMSALFDRIPLDEVSTSMTINAPASILLAMYIAVGKRQGVDPSALRGTIQNDILKEYTARGTYIFPPAPAMRLITDVFSYCAERAPKFNTISVSGYHIREAGATAAQEVAFTMANALAYVEAAVRAGLAVEEFAPRMSFFFSADNEFLEEVAKFRAARRLWASLLQERFGVDDPRARQLRFHAQTAGSTLTAQQPQNNVVRVALQALAAVLGGTQSLHTNSMDEALGLPTQAAARVALRTQQIIAYESGVADTVDPLAGSYALERLTDEVEARARDYLERIRDMGGALAAIQSGFVQREIQEAAYRKQQAVEEKRQIVVGVNEFADEQEAPVEILQLDPDIGRNQRDHLQALRERRDSGRVDSELEALVRAARGDANLMPHLIRCVEADASLGEMCGRLREQWGEYDPPAVV